MRVSVNYCSSSRNALLMRYCFKNSREFLRQGVREMEELTVVAVRQRYSAAAWKERIAICRSSGQTVAEWCSNNGINSKSYYRWERKLLREASQELCCAKQPQQIQCFTEIPPMSCATDVVAVLHVGEITCELRQGIRPEQLHAIVQEIKSHA